MAGCVAIVASIALITLQVDAANLRGVVQSLDGVPLPNTLVILRSAGSKQEIARSATDDAGVYSFLHISPGTFTVEIQSSGFSTGRVQDVRVSEGEDSSIPSVTLQIANCGRYASPNYLRLLEERVGRAKIRGTIVDKRNRPVANAKVQLLCQRLGSCAEMTTDTMGRFAFSPEHGEYSIHIDRSGFFDEEYGNFRAQIGFETVYYPIYLEHCQPGKCQPSRRPISICE